MQKQNCKSWFRNMQIQDSKCVKQTKWFRFWGPTPPTHTFCQMYIIKISISFVSIWNNAFHIQSSQFGKRQIYQTTKSNYSKHKGWMNPLSWHVTYLDHDSNDSMNERSLNQWKIFKSMNWVSCLFVTSSLTFDASIHSYLYIPIHYIHFWYIKLHWWYNIGEYNELLSWKMIKTINENVLGSIENIER